MSNGLHKLVWIFFALALFTVSGSAYAEYDEGKSRLGQRIKVQLAEEKNMVFTSPPQMYRDYQSNELAADEKYKGKWIQIKGRVLSVAKGPSGKPYVTFAADQYGMARIQATLFSFQIGEVRGKGDFDAITDMQVAVTLRKGQEIIVEGKGLGAIMGIPRLGSCLVVPQ